jgi:hypothetical protein
MSAERVMRKLRAREKADAEMAAGSLRAVPNRIPSSEFRVQLFVSI